jgi:chemotaxis response regulator CheB
MSKKKVLLVDDSATVREAVRPLFDSHPDFEVCGEAEHGREAVEKAPSLRPDLIILDLSMPVMNGLEAAPLHQDPAPRLAHALHGPQRSRSGPAINGGWNTRSGS